MDDPKPLNFSNLYISSSDSLCNSPIDQVLPQGWNHEPPLFLLQHQHGREENDALLKAMIRSGIPPALRCAVWTSSVMEACHAHEPKEWSDEYRTLAKVRLLDAAWAAVEQQLFSTPADKRDAVAPNFGNHQHLEPYHVGVKHAETQAHVLLALEQVVGIDYCPLLPPLAALLLRFTSESYAFSILREMAHNSSNYFPVRQVEHYAWCKAFGQILQRLHPHTAAAMRENGALEPSALSPIFKHFFLPLLPYDCVLRILDIYTFEGHKVMFRFGVALLCLFQKDVVGVGVRDNGVNNKNNNIDSADQWWKQLKEYTHSKRFKFQTLVQKAYGYHGTRVRRRFPRRHILARMIKLEETKAAEEMEFEVLVQAPRPVGLLQNADTAVLAQPTAVRTHLASWLPPSLRLTKLDLIYSTNIHGRSLDLFYRHVKHAKQTILLAQVLEEGDPVIGVFASHAWRSSPNVYGDGECFLFRLSPAPAKCWKWKPERNSSGQEGNTNNSMDEEEDEDEEHRNNGSALLDQFMVGRDHFISMGGNDGGGSGFRLSEDLTKGESSPAKGYHNEPLPGGLQNFEVGIVEVYQLAREMDGKTAAQYNQEHFTQTLL